MRSLSGERAHRRGPSRRRHVLAHGCRVAVVRNSEEPPSPSLIVAGNRKRIVCGASRERWQGLTAAACQRSRRRRRPPSRSSARTQRSRSSARTAGASRARSERPNDRLGFQGMRSGFCLPNLPARPSDRVGRWRSARGREEQWRAGTVAWPSRLLPGCEPIKDSCAADRVESSIVSTFTCAYGLEFVHVWACAVFCLWARYSVLNSSFIR